ncbi:BTAD domain-containing putative transcriptional regulator [Streptomyces sp. NPDC048751]|uniref:AfsR/SARP family transcriptional regulator n=1 Tax=Streptomyces sp. NPDC048751 TaxID=3365591 RepID=UPI00371CD868
MTARQGPRQISLGPAKQQCVLAALLIDANRVIPVDALLDRVWHDALPPTGRAVLYSYVARIRRLLPKVPAEAEEPAIVRSSGGYMARVYPPHVDVHRFRGLVASARAVSTSDPLLAAERYRAALGLWHGEPLLGLTGPWVEAVREALSAERSAALAECHAAELRAGHHVTLLPELEAVANERPFDEVSLRHLMTALYRCGRGAEAVARYNRTRRLLADELGLDPSPASQELYQELLRATGMPGAGPAGQTALAEPAPGVPAPAHPAQLPPVSRTFTGRTRELHLLDGMLAQRFGPPGTVVLEGLAGVGKTALALQWAHRARGEFPDGELYVDLHGSDPERAPLAPATALARCLRQLGIPVSTDQGDGDELSALWRSVVAQRRLLLLLDDAAGAEQVEPLLPGGRGCATVVTSRRRLDGLVVRHDAHRLTVPALPAPEAAELLTLLLGPARTRAEPEAATLLTEACGGLPYAVQVLAARLERRPEARLAEAARQLDTCSALNVLRTDPSDTISVRALLDTSFASLPVAAQLLFPCLGSVPSDAFRAEDFAAHALCTPAEAERILGALVREHLLEEDGPHAYTVHPLVRCYAAEHRGRPGRPSLLHGADPAPGPYLPPTGDQRPAGRPGHTRHRSRLDRSSSPKPPG